MGDSLPFDDWFTIAKSKTGQAGLPLPKDIVIL
jgi:hypothetical protein